MGLIGGVKHRRKESLDNNAHSLRVQFDKAILAEFSSNVLTSIIVSPALNRPVYGKLICCSLCGTGNGRGIRSRLPQTKTIGFPSETDNQTVALSHWQSLHHKQKHCQKAGSIMGHCASYKARYSHLGVSPRLMPNWQDSTQD